MPQNLRRAQWLSEFVALYAAVAQDGESQARFVAPMLYPSLQRLSPAEAVHLLLSSEDVPGEIQQRYRDDRAA